MTTWVKLRNQDGQFYDRETGFHIRRDEVKELPFPLPVGSITATGLRFGALLLCDAPVEPEDEAAQVAVVEDEDPAAEAEPETEMIPPRLTVEEPPFAGPEAPEIETPTVKPRTRTVKTLTRKAAKR